MLRFEETLHIDATPGRVWDVWSNVEGWPGWTKSMATVEVLGDGTMGLGAKAKVKQPGVPKAIWTVTEWYVGRSFAWRYDAPGNHVVATHAVQPRDGGGSVVTMTIETSGVFPALMRPWLARFTRKNLAMEADGLKARCEAAPAKEHLAPAGVYSGIAL